MHNSAEIGWIGAIIIGGLAGWFAEMFMGSGTGILLNIILGIVGAAGGQLSTRPTGYRIGRLDRLFDRWLYRCCILIGPLAPHSRSASLNQSNLE